MHILLARTMNDGFGKTRRELEESARNYQGGCDKVLCEKLEEIEEIRNMQAHCRSVIQHESALLTKI